MSFIKIYADDQHKVIENRMIMDSFLVKPDQLPFSAVAIPTLHLRFKKQNTLTAVVLAKVSDYPFLNLLLDNCHLITVIQ